MPEQVLIVGAGPTGLVLALWLTRLGIRPRVIDRADCPGTTSRAFAVHARTLEFYDQIGIAEQVIAAGDQMQVLNINIHRKPIARVPFGTFGVSLSAFPFILMLPQDKHEQILGEQLRRQGVSVEWRTELVGFEERLESVRAVVRGPNGPPATSEKAFLCGCDGAHSAVREHLGTGFPGGTYHEVFYVADVVASGPVANREVHFALTREDFCGVFPLHGRNLLRIIGIVPSEVRSVAPITYDHIALQIARTVDLNVEMVNWFSTYHVHNRIAGAFRRGRVFLLGDAAHIHSPAGGQGMNTGIGDAVNLAWKLAAVLQGRAGTRLLDSYGPERSAIAHRIVATTDRIFAFQIARYPGRRLVRRIFFTFWPWLMRFRPFQRLMFRTMSQITLNYRRGPLSGGGAGPVVGGDRLPWTILADGQTNFVPLRSLAWQVHIYGESAPSVAAICAAHGLSLHVAAWEGRLATSGLRRDALYLIRPDGYVAFAANRQDGDGLQRFLAQVELLPVRSPKPDRRPPRSTPPEPSE